MTSYLIEDGDLIIRDLAYMSNDVLCTIIQTNASYLCRLAPSTKAFDLVQEKEHIVASQIDFRETRAYMEAHNLDLIEKKVFLSTQLNILTRLIIIRLPQNAVSERLRKARIENGHNLSKEYIARAHFVLLITNVPIEILPANKAQQLYRLRWQIELVFKAWKSIAMLQQVKKVKPERLLCYIYSKLLIILLCWKFYWIVNKHTYNKYQKTVSIYKFLN